MFTWVILCTSMYSVLTKQWWRNKFRSSFVVIFLYFVLLFLLFYNIMIIVIISWKKLSWIGLYFIYMWWVGLKKHLTRSMHTPAPLYILVSRVNKHIHWLDIRTQDKALGFALVAALSLSVSLSFVLKFSPNVGNRCDEE